MARQVFVYRRFDYCFVWMVALVAVVAALAAVGVVQAAESISGGALVAGGGSRRRFAAQPISSRQQHDLFSTSRRKTRLQSMASDYYVVSSLHSEPPAHLLPSSDPIVATSASLEEHSLYAAESTNMTTMTLYHGYSNLSLVSNSSWSSPSALLSYKSSPSAISATSVVGYAVAAALFLWGSDVLSTHLDAETLYRILHSTGMWMIRTVTSTVTDMSWWLQKARTVLAAALATAAATAAASMSALNKSGGGAVANIFPFSSSSSSSHGDAIGQFLYQNLLQEFDSQVFGVVWDQVQVLLKSTTESSEWFTRAQTYLDDYCYGSSHDASNKRLSWCGSILSLFLATGKRSVRQVVVRSVKRQSRLVTKTAQGIMHRTRAVIRDHVHVLYGGW